MPLYEYQCDACARRVERIQKFSDPPLDTCPHCGGKLTKLLSSPAIQFKGSGWYVTDYARKGESSSKSGGAEKSEKAGGSGDAKTGSSDSKPAEPAAAKPADKPAKD